MLDPALTVGEDPELAAGAVDQLIEALMGIIERDLAVPEPTEV